MLSALFLVAVISLSTRFYMQASSRCIYATVLFLVAVISLPTCVVSMHQRWQVLSRHKIIIIIIIIIIIMIIILEEKVDSHKLII